MGLFKKLFGAKEEAKKESTSDNYVCLDIGNSEVKILYKGRYHSFKACIEEVLPNSAPTNQNAIWINDKFYVGSSDLTELSDADRKIDRENIRELIIYSLAKVGAKGAIDVYMLLPKWQLDDEPKFRQLLQGAIKFKMNLKEVSTMKINLVGCYPEGEMAAYCLNRKKPNLLVFDIGCGTSDIFVFDKNNDLVNDLPVGVGTRDLVGKYVKVLPYLKDNDVINKLLQEQYPFNSKEQALMREVDGKFLKRYMANVKHSLLSYQNPYSTEITFVGGGAKALEGSLKEWFKKSNFTLTFLSAKDSKFANVSGLNKFVKKYLLKNNNSYVDEGAMLESAISEEHQFVEVLETESANTEKVLTSKEPVEGAMLESANLEGANNQSAKVLKKEEKKKRVRVLKDEGYNQREISDMTGIGYSTVRQYLKEE